MNFKAIYVTLTGLLFGMILPAEVVSQIHPSAVFAFHERGSGVQGYGTKVSDILFAELSLDPEIYLVEREEIQRVLQEQELNISGMVTPGTAAQIGQLTGAKLLITGSVIEADESLYLVAKVIGTETGRVLGEKIVGSFDDPIGGLAEQLAQKVSAIVKDQADKLVADVVTQEDHVANINTNLGDSKRPTVWISIEEQHVGQAVIDPAAETELRLIAQQCGFQVVDSASGTIVPDVLITGEAFSEFATRRGNLVSVKARVEVKAVERSSSKVLASDRQTDMVVDLAELIAGKTALQNCAAAIAARLLPKLAQ